MFNNTLILILALCSSAAAQEIRQATARTAANSPKPNVATQITQPVVPDVVAEVNGDKITAQQLATESIRLHGATVLSLRIKRTLIDLECQRLGISVSEPEINAEIESMSKQFSLPVEQFLKMLQNERNVNIAQYKEDILWPLLAIRKLAASRLTVSDEDISKEIESLYGPGVQVREIVTNARSEAEMLRSELLKAPESFANIAKSKSLNSVTAPYGGLVPPIRRHSVDPNLENTVFALKVGEISPVVEWPKGNFIIFKCEQHFPARDVDIASIKEKLVLKIRDDKTRKASEDVFLELERKAKVEMIADNPVLAAQFPNVAARVNGYEITNSLMSRLCIERFGNEVLRNMISKMLIWQECNKNKIQVSQVEIDNDIRETAMKNMMPKADGTPDIDGWLRLQLREQGVTLDVYKNNTVWPVLALKRLASPSVQMTEEDIQKGFEANYGPRVRCLAIVSDNARRAQDVWMQAKNVANPDHFADLAAKHSVDQESRDGRGVIPLIQKFGGQPLLEEHAFKLAPGEMSEIIQLRDQFVILYCLGQTKPVVADINDVREEIQRNIFEKKLLLAMEQYISDVYARATITNYLAGTNQMPNSNEIPDAAPSAVRKIMPLQPK